MLTHGYDDSKLDNDYANRGRTYIGYEDEVLQNRAINRYKFCLPYIKTNDFVLDAACGSGYGSSILAEKATVFGIDISEHAIEYAQTNYASANIHFAIADLGARLPHPDGTFDVVVSIETIEHVTFPHRLITEFYRVLKPGGLLLLSTVDHDTYSNKGGIRNQFHTGELTKQELSNAVGKRFRIKELYGQLRYHPLSKSQAIGKAVIPLTLKAVALIDILNIRKKLVQGLPISLSNQNDSDFELIDQNNHNDYFQLMIVGVK